VILFRRKLFLLFLGLLVLIGGRQVTAATARWLAGYSSWIFVIRFDKPVKSYFFEKGSKTFILRIPEKIEKIVNKTRMLPNYELPEVKVFTNFTVFQFSDTVYTRVLMSKDKKTLEVVFFTRSFMAYARAIAEVVRRYKEAGKTVVMLDPGHGGKDPGVVWKGIKEKDVVLDVAKYIASYLKKNGIGVVLTRSDDYYLSLRERVELVWQARPDFFLSIHVNSCRDKKVRGIEIFYLSPEPSKDWLDVQLVARENMQDTLGVIGEPEGLVIDLKKKEFIRKSAQFASKLFMKLKKRGLIVRKVKSALLTVLTNLVKPSVLLEIGFITNTEDRKLLFDRFYKMQLAMAIFETIKEMKKEYAFEDRTVQTLKKTRKWYVLSKNVTGKRAIEGEVSDSLKVSRVSQYRKTSLKTTSPSPKIQKRWYVVKKGDTLFRISKKFGVDWRCIKRANGLRDDRIEVGQKLLIPSKCSK